jgi:hypothetical protein
VRIVFDTGHQSSLRRHGRGPLTFSSFAWISYAGCRNTLANPKPRVLRKTALRYAVLSHISLYGQDNIPPAFRKNSPRLRAKYDDRALVIGQDLNANSQSAIAE